MRRLILKRIGQYDHGVNELQNFKQCRTEFSASAALLEFQVAKRHLSFIYTSTKGINVIKRGLAELTVSKQK